MSGSAVSKDDSWSIQTEEDSDLRKPWMTITSLETPEVVISSSTQSLVWLLGRKAGSSSQVRFSLFRIMLGRMTSPHMGRDMWRNGGPYSNVQSISEQFRDRIPASVSRRRK